MGLSEPIAVICAADLGWKTVRKRWAEALPLEFESVRFFHPEEQSPRGTAWFSANLRRMLNTRTAARLAMAAGFKRLLVATNTDAVLLPRNSGARYYIYMDAGHAQGRWIYSHRAPNLKMKARVERMRKLAREGHSFLCMSRLAAHGAANEYQAKSEVISVIPPPINTDLFKPRARDGKSRPFRVLFNGADFERKGGDILLKLAREQEFATLEWHFLAGGFRIEGFGDHVVFHQRYEVDSSALIAAIQNCDVLALPTRADLSPLAAIEAHACGLPVIIRNIGACAEIVHDASSGFVLDKSEPELVRTALRFYIENPGRLCSHGAAGRDQVKRENSYTVHARLLREAVERS